MTELEREEGMLGVVAIVAGDRELLESHVASREKENRELCIVHELEVRLYAFIAINMLVMY